MNKTVKELLTIAFIWIAALISFVFMIWLVFGAPGCKTQPIQTEKSKPDSIVIYITGFSSCIDSFKIIYSIRVDTITKPHKINFCDDNGYIEVTNQNQER
jgi:hypothetical protein